MDNDELKPCPFCGHVLDPDNYIDSIHPTGIAWRETECGRMYYRGKVTVPSALDGECWVLRCLEIEGGCGAEMHGDSREEVIKKWNRRDG